MAHSDVPEVDGLHRAAIQFVGGKAVIAVLTHHWAKPAAFEEAYALLVRNGRAQSKAPGFVSRTMGVSLNDETQITSFVVWESGEIYDRWKGSEERAAVMSGAERLWARPPQSERFHVGQ